MQRASSWTARLVCVPDVPPVTSSLLEYILEFLCSLVNSKSSRFGDGSCLRVKTLQRRERRSANEDFSSDEATGLAESCSPSTHNKFLLVAIIADCIVGYSSKGMITLRRPLGFRSFEAASVRS